MYANELHETANPTHCIKLVLTVKGVGILLIYERVHNILSSRVVLLVGLGNDAILSYELLLQFDNLSLALVLFGNDPDEGCGLKRVSLQEKGISL